jgi:predicted ATPase
MLAGCAPITVQKIERDERRPSVQLAQLLAQHLQIPQTEQENFVRRARGEFVPLFESPADMAVAGEQESNLPTTKVRHNLPSQPTPFIGREDELTALHELLAQARLRLVTVVGAGGMGKTRLALAVAERLLHDTQPSLLGNGVFFVPLAALNDPEQIVLALAEALRFPLDSRGEQRRTAKEQVFDYLREKRLLLILDNFEHLLDGVPLVVDILRTAVNVQILVTSCERLQLQEEQVYPIEGLAFPEKVVDDMGAYTAVQLFLQAAQRIQPDFVLQADDLPHLTRICQLVGGIPLGVELAAGWVDMLPLAEIASEMQRSSDFLETELRDVPERHRSMRVVFKASWQRLTADEQAVFPQLSVFRGGFTRQAGQAVTGASLRLLGRLVSKSLLQYDRQRDRYQIHELLRQFGAELLAGQTSEVLETSEILTIYERHASYYCQALYDRWPRLQGREHKAALAEIEADSQNVRVAWEWAVAHERNDLLTKARDSLGYFYEWQGRYEAGEQAFRRASETLPDEASNLIWHGRFLHVLGQTETAVSQLQQALIMLAQDDLTLRDMQLNKAIALQHLGNIGHDQARFESAQSHLEESLALFQAVGDELSAANVLISLSKVLFPKSDYVGTNAFAQQGLRIYQNLGFERGVAQALERMSMVARVQGEIEDSEQLAVESLNIYERLGHLPLLAYGQSNLGIALHWVGKNREAEVLIQKSLLNFKEIGDGWGLTQAYFRLGVTQANLGKYNEAHRALETALSLARITDALERLGYSLLILGSLELAEDNYDEAKQHLLESLDIFQQYQDPSLISRVYGALGIYYLLTGDEKQAQGCALKTLQIAIKISDVLTTAYGIGTAAVLLAAQGQPERAVALNSLCLENVPIYRVSLSVEAKMREPLTAVTNSLPPDVATAACKQGKEMDFWQTAESLLTELTELGWND